MKLFCKFVEALFHLKIFFMIQRQVSFIEAIKIALSKYCCFSGRASRSEFWWFVLFLYCVQFVMFFISYGIFGEDYAEGMREALAGDMYDPTNEKLVNALINMYIIPCIAGLVFFLPMFGLLFRRLHDTGRSGFWWLIGFVPVVGGIVLLVFTLQSSVMYENKYGPVPNMVGGEMPPRFSGRAY